MKRLIVTFISIIALVSPLAADEVKIGVLLGFTGPAESLAPNMANGAELAFKEASDSGEFLRHAGHGSKIVPIRADSTCTKKPEAQAAAERLITSEKVSSIVGALCSGVTISILQNVAMPKGIVLFSPSATSPALSDMKDNGLFFRASPSDARQGQVIADLLTEKGYKSIAMTYTNNDYGKGLADSIENNFKAAGGKVNIVAAHEDGKADYGAEVAALAQAGGDILVVAGYLDQGGKGIIQASLDSGAFDNFFLPDGMIGPSLVKAIGNDLNGSIGTVPGTDSDGSKLFGEMAKAAGFEATPFSDYSYDAAAMTILAMQAAGSSESQKFKDKVFDIANAPGEKILPGQLAKALKILAQGGDIDYVGATDVTLIGEGESSGSYREILVKDNEMTTVQIR